ncbi:MAG: hypothetical protein M2R45_01499 [Verrucomicrobia subdivision 3 bacterium]|nr:hypothetical protein [Limisphaerales bacterium]MCS1413371.1 hypothetical protein [Limisphaerales bacterium]
MTIRHVNSAAANSGSGFAVSHEEESGSSGLARRLQQIQDDITDVRVEVACGEGETNTRRLILSVHALQLERKLDIFIGCESGEEVKELRKIEPTVVRRNCSTRPTNNLLTLCLWIKIMADDTGTEALGRYGGNSYQIPNIDRLTQTDLRFNHAYATLYVYSDTSHEGKLQQPELVGVWPTQSSRANLRTLL